MRIVGPITLASRNAGKLDELRALCRGALELRLLPATPEPPVVPEDHDTYLGNALEKARAIAAFVGCAALADDSGLEVDALPGLLGVRSARYGTSGLDDHGRCELLLRALENQSDRRARFRCVVVLAQGDEWISAEGTLEGEITRAPRGSGGFGYDPVFLLPDRRLTLAELPASEKNRLSHRAVAMRALLQQLRAAHVDSIEGES